MDFRHDGLNFVGNASEEVTETAHTPLDRRLVTARTLAVPLGP
jgi:hypothetical protein